MVPKALDPKVALGLEKTTLFQVFRQSASNTTSQCSRPRSVSGIDSGHQEVHIIDGRAFLECSSWARVFAPTI
jgi:hypothetical protein